jgi:ligand-binding sensor domain-containing protein
MIFKNHVLVDRENNKWFVGFSSLRPTREYLVRYDGITFTYFDLDWPRGHEKHYRALALDKEGDVWAGGHDNWAFYFDGYDWHEFYVPGTFMYYDGISDIQLDQKGRLYISHEHGIGTSDGAIILGGPEVYDMAVCKQNNLWCTIKSIGIGVFDQKQWRYIGAKDGILTDQTCSIACDSSGNIWLTYDYQTGVGKISRYDGQKWQHIIPDGMESDDFMIKPYVDNKGAIWFCSNQKILMYQDTTSTKVVDLPNSEEDRNSFFLCQAYPNPFNSTTKIFYKVIKSDFLNLTVYNINGREVVQLINEKHTEGNYELIWNGQDQYGMEVTSGMYLCMLKGDKLRQSNKIILIR